MGMLSQNPNILIVESYTTNKIRTFHLLDYVPSKNSCLSIFTIKKVGGQNIPPTANASFHGRHRIPRPLLRQRRVSAQSPVPRGVALLLLPSLKWSINSGGCCGEIQIHGWMEASTFRPYFVFVFFFPEDGFLLEKKYSATFEFEDFWSNPVVGGKSFNHFENIIYIFLYVNMMYIYIYMVSPQYMYIYIRTYKYTLYPHRESEGVN